MVISCSGYNCTNRQGATDGSGGNLLFHRFPMKNPLLLKKWVHATKREKWIPTKCSYLCSEHFDDSDYKYGKGKKSRLKVDAVPSKFNFPAHMTKVVKARRELQFHASPPVPPTDTMRNEAMGVEQMEVDVSDIASSSIKHASVQTSPFNSPTKEAMKKRIKALKMQRLRLRQKITKMEDIIAELKKKSFGNQELIDILENSFDSLPILPVLKSHFGNLTKYRTRRRYSKEMQEFALTLHFYSPRAYKFVRKFLILPHKSLLTKWITSINGEPGILHGVTEYLKKNCVEKPHLKDLALIIDSMAIRAQKIYDRKSGCIIGNTDLAGIGQENDVVAREALFLQVVSYSQPFKAPVAYFLVDKVNSDVQSQIITAVIEHLHDVGVSVRSLTCDGTQSNLTTLRKLGCSLPETNFFPHPKTAEEISVFLDACHMLKLARNALAECRNFESEEGVISWKYIEMLAALQDEERLKFANNLSWRHINYRNKIMNVSLAAQTLSSGVGDAIDFLRQSGHPHFIGSEATVGFIRRIDEAFDVLNSRSPFGTGWKQPIRACNIDFITEKLGETSEYLSGLTVNGNSILSHRRKTFVLGLVTCIKSVHSLASKLFSSCNLKYFLTYKVSQDHLELLFNCIRGLGGWNNNPNVMQLKSAVRKVQLRSYIAPSATGNCRAFDDEVCGILSPTNKGHQQQDGASTITEEWANKIQISCWSRNILNYVAGFIVKQLLAKVNCVDCRRLLVPNNTTDGDIPSDHNYCKINKNKDTSFVNCVNRGGLTMATPWVLKIVLAAETVVRSGVEAQQKILISVSKKFLELETPFQHPTVTGPEEDLHETQLIKQIVSKFALIRLSAKARTDTLQLQKNRASLRHKLSKVILFQNL